jgi:hypothetical protein
MRRLLGVENGRLALVGRFNPLKHKGVDVFAPPGSRVFVPRFCRLDIVEATYDPDYYKGQARGRLYVCGRRYGVVIAHLDTIPSLGLYLSGEQYGEVAGFVRFTPHVHIALAHDHMPPPGEVDPVRVWKRCLRKRRS